MSVQVIHADCREAIKDIPDCSVDSCVTDGPYALVSIVKRFGKDGAAPAQSKEGGSGVYKRASAGFMGQKWDTGETYFDPEFWREVWRVLKPGAHVVAFAGTRTYHRLACAIEDGGFEIRDQIAWLYGSGFPKSHDVSKGIDKALGRERSKVRVDAPKNPPNLVGGVDKGGDRPWRTVAAEQGYHEAVSDEAVSDEAVSDEAVEWQGWGTALKPALEPICLARKPLSGTVAATVLKHGTGALNIDGCRVEYASEDDQAAAAAAAQRLGHDEPGATYKGIGKTGFTDPRGSLESYLAKQHLGRWPANVLHDGSEEVLAEFPDSNTNRSTVTSTPGAICVNGAGLPSHTGVYGADESDSAARFFYQAKADSDDRMGSRHPTVKPVNLMRWLVRLVTPKGGLVLDPFAGSGSTGVAAIGEGMKAILIEREAQYVTDIQARIAHVKGEGPHSETLKARKRTPPKTDGGLFA